MTTTTTDGGPQFGCGALVFALALPVLVTFACLLLRS